MKELNVDNIENAIVDFEIKKDIIIFPNRLRLAEHIVEFMNK